ncbi:type II CAAX endopeptidase family protein [Chryseolinea sp. H1M3-3]|uniref:type II CAAX endopeptidase family protein n=1 Tax=Chryseolinea sp. H1M3-3 TaxID=3034144 RepID=UPI0023EB45FC|nr:type II CAAX endopeptidase family protein [Chryseolinea sp. H1M3-3]
MKSLRKLIVLVIVFAFMAQGHAQQQSLLKDHQHYLTKLTNAKDSLYKEILASFDAHIKANPTDIEIQLEKCRIIDKAYYDSYEEYNPNYEEAKACAADVVKRFPGNPEALLYQGEFLYGDSLTMHLEHLRDLSKENESLWEGYAWKVYKQLAEQYHYNEEFAEAAQFGELAIAHNDTLDLSLLLAESYKNQSLKSKAIDALLNGMDSTDEAWTLNQKGKLLLELGVPDKAMDAFRMSSKKNAQMEDAGALGQAMIDNGLWEEARPYLLKASASDWSFLGLQKLLEYDLKYSSADSVQASYERYVEKDFWNDPVGIYRLRLTFSNPLSGWLLSDVGRILLLVLLIVLPFVLPYLWILPIHYYGMWQRQRGKIFSETTFKWGLRQFWLVCSFWLLSDVVAYLLFNYNDFIGIFNSRITSEAGEVISKHLANATLFFFSSLAVVTMAFLKNEDIANFITKMRNSAIQIRTGIGLAFALRIGLAVYAGILHQAGISLEDGSSVFASINDSIISINSFYSPYLGFLFVVILVPFYEEVLFRGIFLSACERNMKFLYANILQSLVFALVHQNLKLFVFYFAFGMLAGHFRQQSQGLIISTSMHMANNLMAFLFITMRS